MVKYKIWNVRLRVLPSFVCVCMHTCRPIHSYTTAYVWTHAWVLFLFTSFLALLAFSHSYLPLRSPISPFYMDEYYKSQTQLLISEIHCCHSSSKVTKHVISFMWSGSPHFDHQHTLRATIPCQHSAPDLPLWTLLLHSPAFWPLV